MRSCSILVRLQLRWYVYRMDGRHAVETHVMQQRNVFSPAAAVLVLLSLFTCGSFGQTSGATTSPPPLYSTGPITDYDAAFPNFRDVLQFRRGERYNIPNSSLPLGEDSDVGIFDLPPSHFRKDAMPFDASDAVVIGTVTAGQSHLSNDRRDLYSEFKLTLQGLVKNSAPPYLRVDDSIDIQRKGGAIRLPSGKVLTRAVLADSMPQIGGRYLLFLKYDQSTEDYSILMGYQLNGNEVYRLDGLNSEDSNFLEVVHLLRREGVSEREFLARAKSTFLSQETRVN